MPKQNYKNEGDRAIHQIHGYLLAGPVQALGQTRVWVLSSCAAHLSHPWHNEADIISRQHRVCFFPQNFNESPVC